MKTTNLEKHTTTNPLSRLFLSRFSQVLREEVSALSPDSVLDVGAGEGFTLHMLATHHIGKRREGIEYADEAIAFGKQLHPDVVIKKGDIYALPYKDNEFDVIICSEVLEHLEDPSKALDELRRVTKKYLVLSVPNEPFFTIQRFLRGKNMLRLGDHPEHIQHWTTNSFRTLVASKLKIKKVRTPLPWNFVIAEK